MEVNGAKIEGSPELRIAIAQLAPGAVAQIEVERDGQTLQVPVKLAKLPPEPPSPSSNG
jgi:S1-C subfamily serine protease